MNLRWDDDATLYGTRIRPSFFDGEIAKAELDAAKRILPFLRATAPIMMFTETDRQNFYCDQLSTQPDAVFAHGSGLIAVEYKHKSERKFFRNSWQDQIRLGDMLQCVICGYAVAQNYKKTTACVLRYHNVCFLLTPSTAVMHAVLDLIPLALQYYGESRRVSASQLAKFAIPKVESMYPQEDKARSEAGRLAHETVLRR